MWFFGGLVVGIIAASMIWSFLLKAYADIKNKQIDDLSTTDIKNIVKVSSLENENAELRSQVKRARSLLIQMKDEIERLNRIRPVNKSVPSQGGITWLDVFGFSKNDKVTKELVEARYRALAKVYHPDISGSEFAMKRLNQAKEFADKKFK